MSKSRKPPEDDEALWREVTKNVTPLPGRPRVPPKGPAVPGAEPSSPPGMGGVRRDVMKAPLPVAPVPLPPLKSGASPGVDRRTSERLRKGRMAIDGRIDLHGMRQGEAHNALRVFLFRSQARGCRMVLVITGKGGPSTASAGSDRFGPLVHEGSADRGVLRRNVPLWLAEPDLRPIVVGHVPAHIRHGGDGALYVQLRRIRQA